MIDDKLIIKSVKESVKKILETIEPPADSANSERAKQDFISKKIDSAGVRKKGKTEEGEVEEKDEDEETGKQDPDLRDKFDKKDDKSLKDDEKFSYEVPDSLPQKPQFKHVLKQLNFLRSGASTNDSDVKNNLLKYYDALGDQEKKDLLAMMSGFATIMNKAGDVEDAPSPSDYSKEKSPEKLAPIKKKDSALDSGSVQVAKQAPIVVGEVANKTSEYTILIENNSESYRCMNGDYVNFGSDRCLDDIVRRIEDASDTRDSCKRGTEKRSHYNGMLKYLRVQLRSAQKINGGS